MFCFCFSFLCTQDRRFLIYSIALIISVIFLSLTLAIGFLLPSNHHVLHCRCQTYYVGCLLIGDGLLAINQLAGSLITGIPCLVIGKNVWMKKKEKQLRPKIVLIFGLGIEGIKGSHCCLMITIQKGQFPPIDSSNWMELHRQFQCK